MMDKDGVLPQMASYDFTVPLKATIIFEDSEEENENITSSNNIEVENKSTETNNYSMKSDVVASPKNINKAPSLPIIDIDPIAYRYNISGINGLNDFIEGPNNNTINKSSPNREQLKRKTNEQELLSNKIPKQNEEHSNNTITAEQYQRQLNLVQQTFNDSKPNTTNEVSVCYNKNNQFKQISTYVIDLLEKVSENLIHILKSYHEHVFIEMNNKYNLKVVEDSRTNLRRVKNHYFNLSYCTVLTIILPQINNVMFYKEFLDITVKTARKFGLNYQHQQLEPLYNEMIHWTKGKKQYLDSVHSEYSNKNSNSALNQNLTTSSNLPTNKTKVKKSRKKSIPNKIPKKFNNLDNTCIFSSGPPGKEIRIQLYSNNEVNYNQQSPGHNIYPSSKQDFGEHCRLNVQPQTHEDGKYGSMGISQITAIQEEIYHLQNPTRPNAPAECFSTNNMTHQATSWTAHSTSPQYYNDNQQILGRSIHNDNKLILGRNSHNDNQQILRRSNHNANQQILGRNSHNDNQQILGRSSHNDNQQILGRSSHNDNQQIIERSSHNNYQQMSCRSFQLQNQSGMHYQVDNTRSSVSRDSGFISPLDFNTSIDPRMIQGIEEERGPEQPVAPHITLVTSLNPTASFIKDGLCCTCGKTTKTKCLGCYKPYYCSQECQQYDWAIHRVECNGAQNQNAGV